MTGSGTDRTRPAVQAPAPLVILVEPQLAENIGMAARAMANALDLKENEIIWYEI